MPTCVRCGRNVPAEAAACPACGTPNPEAPTMLAAAGAATELLEQSPLAQQLQAALGPNFLVENEIGEGGFAHVFSVADRKLSREIAVKVLRPEFTGSRQSVQRFIREAESAAKLNHPNILPIFFVGEGQGLVYFGMPMVQGEPLDAKLRREGQQSEAEVIRIGTDIADALAEAHAQGLVHRDVKPQNVMLQGTKQRVLVADFGIAKAASGSGERLTGTGVIIGSPHYMSPEQASGAPEVDLRSDIYSLGVVLWEMLAGEVPFDGPSTQGILIQHLTKTMPAIRTKRPTVSAQLAKVVARCTAKKPEDRFQTAAELADALRACAATASAEGAAPRGFHLPRQALFGAAAVVVVAAGLLLWRGLGSRTAAAPGAADGVHSNAARLAVLPFDVSGTDSTLARSVAQLLTDAVTQRYQVPAVDSRDLVGRWTEEKRRTTAPLADNASFAYGLGANQMVIGSAVAAGRDLRLSVDVYDTHDLSHVVHGDATGTRDSLFGLVDRLAARVATAMCTQPEFNPARLCYDTPARPKGPLSVQDNPEPGEQPPVPASFFVLVDSTGEGSDVRVRTPSNHEDINAFSLAAVRQADYVPATRGGKPVTAWTSVTVAITGNMAAKPVSLPTQCRDPRYGNPNHACFDTRPAPLVATTLAWHGSGTPPTAPTFWVRVSDAGTVLDVRPISTSSDSDFSVQALNAAKDYKFNPAQKHGRPVEAWTQIAITPAQ